MAGNLDGILGKVVYSLVVVTTSVGGKPFGMTAAWVSKVSSEPLMLAVSLSHKSFTSSQIKEKGFLGINLLGTGGKAAAHHFGSQSGRDVDKFAGMEFKFSGLGNPILNQGTVAFIDCKVVRHMEAGDHTLFLAEMLDGCLGTELWPLAYCAKKFYKLSEI
ncbi:flavin reductase family protein [Desulfoferula mesophila]|uniref:Flavin oxidoreductase n=1 Tax=Desulfoferula mesophila TaxID=3058419 RepID=A0AAU9ER29_9BACT|nr:flavin oxidoreductase [Desulfoferula mesophilus]